MAGWLRKCLPSLRRLAFSRIVCLKASRIHPPFVLNGFSTLTIWLLSAGYSRVRCTQPPHLVPNRLALRLWRCPRRRDPCSSSLNRPQFGKEAPSSKARSSSLPPTLNSDPRRPEETPRKTGLRKSLCTFRALLPEHTFVNRSEIVDLSVPGAGFEPARS